MSKRDKQDESGVLETPPTEGVVIVRPISKKGARMIAQAELLESGMGYVKVIPAHTRRMPDGTVREVAEHYFVAKITEKTIKARKPAVIKLEDARVTAARELLQRAAKGGTSAM